MSKNYVFYIFYRKCFSSFKPSSKIKKKNYFGDFKPPKVVGWDFFYCNIGFWVKSQVPTISLKYSFEKLSGKLLYFLKIVIEKKILNTFLKQVFK